MSLEKDITGVKHNLDEDVFKSASKDDLKGRKAEHLAALKAQGVTLLPVNSELQDLENKKMALHYKIMSRVLVLQDQSGVAENSRDNCICNSDLLDIEGDEYTELPGEHGPEGWCLRCGGYKDSCY